MKTLQTARERKDYEFKKGFKGEGITEKEFLKIMRTNNTNGFFEDSPLCKNKKNCRKPDSSEGYRGLIIMQIGYVDIELNLYSYDNSRKGKEWTPDVAFFICTKYGEGEYDWDSYSFIDEELNEEEIICNIDWSKENWYELLEKDMFNKLSLFVERKNWDINKPIG